MTVETPPLPVNPVAQMTGKLKSRMESVVGTWIGQEQKALNEQFVGYLARSVILEEMGPPRRVRSGITVVLGFILLFIIVAAFTKIDEKAPAPGAIMPQGFVQRVEHMEGGRIARILVADGERVTAGQPLVLLNDIEAHSDFEAMAARNAGLILRAERWRALAMNTQPDFSKVDKRYAALILDEQKLYDASVSFQATQRQLTASEHTQMKARLDGLSEQQSNVEAQLAALSEQLAMRKELLAKGLTSKVVYLETERAVAATRESLSRIKTQVAEAAVQALQAQGRLVEQTERWRTEALEEMGAAQKEQAQVIQHLDRLKDRVERTTVRAPADGIVNKLAFHAPGEVVQSGGHIADIVPDKQELLAKVRVHPRDIGYVKPGNQALVKVETYNFARFGGVPGVVQHVSASSFTDPNTGEIYFEALINLDKPYIGVDPQGFRLVPGMTLVADIETGRKSLMSYLLKPLAYAWSNAFSER